MSEPSSSFSGEDLEDLYENAPCGYLSLRPDGRIVKVNVTLCSWIGYPAEALLGKRFLELLNIAGRMFYETHFAPLLRMQGFFNEVALDLVTAGGERLPVLANALERRDAEGKLLFTRVTLFKASQRRRYERDLVEARAIAEATTSELRANLSDERIAAELREQFIAVLGHDLRSPLAAITSAMHLLEREQLSERGERVMALVNSTVIRMSNLIDDVMDFARGRLGGGIKVERATAVSIAPVLEQVVAELRTSHPDRAINVRLDLSQDIRCDPIRLAQLLSNLMGNALTYGAQDQPIVVGASTTEAIFELSVANSGDPIPAEALDKLFEPFVRGEVRPSKQGLGLGLYIAAQIAEAHAGRINVVSTVEETRFTLRMPIA
jgi:phosphoserine phosphatase RsbU/P